MQLTAKNSTLLFSLLLTSLLVVNKNFISIQNSVLTLVFVLGGYLWIQSKVLNQLDNKSLLQISAIFLLISLPISIWINDHFIRSLFDFFVWKSGVNPYLYPADDLNIGQVQTEALYNLLNNKEALSSVSPPLLILTSPIFYLYEISNLFIATITIRILITAVFLWITFKEIKLETSFLLLNPLIWILGIGQIQTEVFALFIFLYGYRYYSNEERQNAYLIWGLLPLFGWVYTSILIFITASKTDWRFLIYSITTASVWLILFLDLNALHQLFFEVNWAQSLSFLNSYWSISMALIFSILLGVYAQRIKSNMLLLVLMISTIIFLPLEMKLIWGLLALISYFILEYKAEFRYAQWFLIVLGCIFLWV